MKLLLDTHLLVWTSGMASAVPSRSMPAKALALIVDEENLLYFSPVSVWEVAIKNAQGRAEFLVDPHLFRRALLDNGYIEIAITSEHTAGVANLPGHHKDPFDRLLIAQATVEGMMLLTNDEAMAKYPGPIQKV
jgi:PIN domain nuclease of toxin-antitoxin system